MNLRIDPTLREKNASIAKMFSRYPSLHGKGPEEMAMMISAYLETTRGFHSGVFSNACETLSKRNSPFPPSAGELHSECSRIAADDFKAHHPEPKRLPRPDYSSEHRAAMQKRLVALSADMQAGRMERPHECGHGYSADQLSDWSLIINAPGREPYIMRVDADGLPLTIPVGYPGGGQKVKWGYLTPFEAKEPHERSIVVKTVLPSFIEKWERENGREHIGRVHVLNSKRQAAE